MAVIVHGSNRVQLLELIEQATNEIERKNHLLLEKEQIINRLQTVNEELSQNLAASNHRIEDLTKKLSIFLDNPDTNIDNDEDPIIQTAKKIFKTLKEEQAKTNNLIAQPTPPSIFSFLKKLAVGVGVTGATGGIIYAVGYGISAGASAGAQAGATIGSIGGPVGAAAGSVVGTVLGSVAGGAAALAI